MQDCSLPGLDPVAFSIGPLSIRWYALAYLAGILLGWRYALYLARLYGPRVRPGKEDIDEFLLWAVLGVILGGRLGYILFYNFDYYTAEPIAILRLWEGGMAFHGGVIGVIIAMIAYAVRHKVNVLRLSDIVVCAVPIGLFFGRIANFINGELYGRITGVSWAVRFPCAGAEPRHPSQLYEAGLEGAVLFGILFVLARMKKVRAHPGVLSAVFLIGYGMARFAVEYTRAPDPHLGLVFAGMSMGQILSLPMIAGGLALAGISWHLSRGGKGAAQ